MMWLRVCLLMTRRRVPEVVSPVAEEASQLAFWGFFSPVIYQFISIGDIDTAGVSGRTFMGPIAPAQ